MFKVGYWSRLLLWSYFFVCSFHLFAFASTVCNMLMKKACARTDLMYANPGTCQRWGHAFKGKEEEKEGVFLCLEEERRGVTADDRRRGVIVALSSLPS